MRESRRDVQDRSLISSRLVFFDSFLYNRALLLQVFRRRGSRPTNERITCFRACVGFRLYAPNRCSVLMSVFGCFRSPSRSRHQQHLNIDHSIYTYTDRVYTHVRIEIGKSTHRFSLAHFLKVSIRWSPGAINVNFPSSQHQHQPSTTEQWSYLAGPARRWSRVHCSGYWYSCKVCVCWL